jgi:hypothetical protein
MKIMPFADVDTAIGVEPVPPIIPPVQPKEDTFMAPAYFVHVADSEPPHSVRLVPAPLADACNDNSFCDRVLGAPAPDVKAAIADEAKRIVTGARRSAYGKPEQNFERIARFWTGYMLNTGRDVEITAADVSPLMRLMKEARLCETPDHRDSFVDLVGYTLTGAEINGVA